MDQAEFDSKSKHYFRNGNCEYFVLDVTHDPIAPAALKAYADEVEATHPQLAADIRKTWLDG